MPKGSFFCSSVGDSGLTALASLPKAANMGSSSMPPGDGSGLLSRRMSKSMAAVVVVERGTAAAQEGTCLWCELQVQLRPATFTAMM